MLKIICQSYILLFIRLDRSKTVPQNKIKIFIFNLKFNEYELRNIIWFRKYSERGLFVFHCSENKSKTSFLYTVKFT